ncbi:hypothetical protein CDES_10020 [Corynebacterium deserti GIMN1.010]|uniref:DUF4191 domain-containing protein n=1 Tax=Corynebacterium deserti GIMN1.010 TaxID=931089 RepID=A0A0M3Q9V7_9CORY|nr:DUF4191 domain-containing protein [Corynebacterium deserti]ALC06389.1 hypothetical protein CDES_10020 [Corynebacterium deserti GIMN1.010]
MADANKQAEKAAKKQVKAAKRAQRKQTRSQMWQVFNMQRKQDKALIPLMLLAVLGIPLILFLIGMLWGGEWWMLPIGIAAGVVAAMFIFTRRVERDVYKRAEGQQGAAGWAVENLRSGVGMTWRTKTAVAVTTHMDAVHRVIGLSGVVLVGEGSSHRLKPLMAQQKKRLNRVAPGVPVYEIITGNEEGQVPLARLQRELVKLPRNYKKNEVASLAARIEAMDNVGNNAGAALPKGPMPKGASMSGMNRRARRQAERKGEQ